MPTRLRLFSVLSVMIVLSLLASLNPLGALPASTPTADAATLATGVSASSGVKTTASSVKKVAKAKYKAAVTAKAKAKKKVKVKRTVSVTAKVGNVSATASATAKASASAKAAAKAKASASAKTKAKAKSKATAKAKKLATKKAKAKATKAAKVKAAKKAKKAAKAAAKVKATKAAKAKAAKAPASSTVKAEASKTSTRPGGKPGANNTGVPAGVKLKKHTGDLTITKAGTVIDGLDIHGYVVVKAKNVTIRNSIIRGGNAARPYALVRSDTAGASLTIEDSELVAAHPSPYVDGLRGFNFTARRLNIHGVIDGVHIYGDNVVLEKSWIHNNLHYKNDPNHSDGSHDDGVQIVKGKNVTIRGNHIGAVYNAGIMVGQDSGTVSKLTISNNWLDGGKCTVNLSKKSYAPLKTVTISNNVFGRNVTNPAGDDCAITYAKSTDGGMSLSNNFYGDNSKPAKVFVDKNR